MARRWPGLLRPERYSHYLLDNFIHPGRHLARHLQAHFISPWRETGEYVTRAHSYPLWHFPPAHCRGHSRQYKWRVLSWCVDVDGEQGEQQGRHCLSLLSHFADSTFQAIV